MCEVPAIPEVPQFFYATIERTQSWLECALEKRFSLLQTRNIGDYQADHFDRMRLAYFSLARTRSAEGNTFISL